MGHDYNRYSQEVRTLSAIPIQTNYKIHSKIQEVTVPTHHTCAPQTNTTTPFKNKQYYYSGILSSQQCFVVKLVGCHCYMVLPPISHKICMRKTLIISSIIKLQHHFTRGHYFTVSSDSAMVACIVQYINKVAIKSSIG